jgi:CRP-like cAMP-binding protein
MQHLFEQLGDSERRTFVEHARRRSFKSGTHVFWQGDPGDTLHLVVKGSFAASVSTVLAQTVIIGVFRTDDVFGELALLGAEPRRSATITALELSETLSIDGRRFQEWRARVPELDALIIRALALRLREMTDQFVESLYLPLDTRLARRLLTLSRAIGPQSSGDWVHIRQEELAAYCGVTRTTVNRVLRVLVEQGIIEIGRGRLHVRDQAMLEKRAHAG